MRGLSSHRLQLEEEEQCSMHLCLAFTSDAPRSKGTYTANSPLSIAPKVFLIAAGTVWTWFGPGFETCLAVTVTGEITYIEPGRPFFSFCVWAYGFWPFGIWEYESLILWCRPVPAFFLPLCCHAHSVAHNDTTSPLGLHGTDLILEKRRKKLDLSGRSPGGTVM